MPPPRDHQRGSLARLSRRDQSCATDRALEVATGPDTSRWRWGGDAGEVVGLDLTDAPLAIAGSHPARSRPDQRPLSKRVTAENLPFGPAQFDFDRMPLRLPSFEDPPRTGSDGAGLPRGRRRRGRGSLRERNARTRAAYWNAIERLRDHSHTRALAFERIDRDFRAGGNRKFCGSIPTELTADSERWLAGAQTGASDADQVRADASSATCTRT